MFTCVKTNVGSMNVPESCYYPVKTGESVADGEALALANGALTKATTKVEYIALKAGVGEEVIPVMKVTPYDVYETTTSVDPSEFALGDKLALSSDGLTVGAESDSGIAKIVKFPEAKTVNSKVYVSFI